jgi:hypothetical protein
VSVVLALLATVPCAAGEPVVERYSTTEHTIALPKLSPREWVKIIEGYTDGGWRIEWRDPKTGAQTPYAPVAEDRATNAAIWMGVERFASERWPTEYDLVLAAGSEGEDRSDLRPVTLWIPRSKRTVVVSAGDAIAAPSAGPSTAEVARAHGMAGFRENGASFSPRLTGVIDAALTRLSAAERAAVRDVVLVRQGGKSPETSGRWVNDAVYEVTDDRGSILLYDEILQPTGRFVGPVTAPAHPAMMTLLHELAHAIDDAPRRQLIRAFNTAVEAFNRDAQASNAVVDRLQGTQPSKGEIAALEKEQARLAAVQVELDAMRKRLAAMQPVSTGFRKRFGAITDYGATSDTEAFAEAFGLYHLDREALQRISPDAVAWFAAGEHLGERP